VGSLKEPHEVGRVTVAGPPTDLLHREVGPDHQRLAMWAFRVASNRDVFAIKKSNTGSNSTEIHVLRH